MDQWPPSPSLRMQRVGEEPAQSVCAGFLLTREGGAASHQQPCPPTEALAVPGTPYMTLGGSPMREGFVRLPAFPPATRRSVLPPGPALAHRQPRGAAGCIGPCISLFSPRPPKRGAVCAGSSAQDPCRRRLGTEGLYEPSCLAPAPRSDVGAAGRNSKFLRGHSSHSSAGLPWPPPSHSPPGTRACLQQLLLKPISMAPFQTCVSFHTPGWKQLPPTPCPEAFIQRLLAAAVLFQRVQNIAASAGQEGDLRLRWGLLESKQEGCTG